jgi:DNA-binding CsgD family transcriptional regulator
MYGWRADAGSNVAALRRFLHRHMPNHSTEIAGAGPLIREILDIEQSSTLPVVQRQALLNTLSELLQADAGHWAWGRGRPENATIMPVAVIPFGYTEHELSAFYKFGFDPRLREEFNLPLLSLLRDDNTSCATRGDIFPDDEWTSANWVWQSFRQMGKGEWIHCVRYATNDTWSNMTFFRNLGRENFSSWERTLLDLAISSIPMLWANPEETIPAAMLSRLTPRQRAVLFMLLDGQSRKRAATRLGIAEETFNHHVKAIYQHFEVQSATELAALFLRNR